MCTHECPDEVQWRKINLKLQRHMTKLELQSPEYCIHNVPEHLAEDDIKQYEVTAYFSDAESVDQTLYDFDLNWSGVSYGITNSAARAEGGAVFRRKGVSGYFVLKRPCLSCYIKIAKRCNDNIEVLKKACVTCSFCL